MLVEYYLDKQSSGKALVDKLLALPTMRYEVDSIEEIYFELRSIWTSFKGLDLSGAQNQTLMFCTIADTKLTPGLRKSWAKKIEDKADATHPIGHTACENDLFSVINREIKLQRGVSKPSRKDGKKDHNLTHEGFI